MYHHWRQCRRRFADRSAFLADTASDEDAACRIFTGGNVKIRQAGSTITGGNVAGDIKDAGEGAAVLAHNNVLNRLSAPTGALAPSPEGGWPTSTFLSDQKKLYFNGEGIDIFHPDLQPTPTATVSFTSAAPT